MRCLSIHQAHCNDHGACWCYLWLLGPLWLRNDQVLVLQIKGADSIYRCLLTTVGNPIVETRGPSVYGDHVSQVWGYTCLKIRQSWDHLIFNMEIPILVRWHLYIETDPRQSDNGPISTKGFPMLVRWHLYIESGPSTWEVERLIHLKASAPFMKLALC